MNKTKVSFLRRKGEVMPKMKLSKSEIDKLKYTDKGRLAYWDTDTPGLGLVVGAKTKTFVLQLDVKTTDTCLLYTSPSPRDRTRSRMPSSA